jgi:hypothetical protein
LEDAINVGCLVILVALALAVLAVLTLHQHRKKRLVLRGWGALVLAISVLASFPLSVITTAAFLIQANLMAPSGPALWVTEGWEEHGRFMALAWVLGFPLVIKLKGVEFASRHDAAWSIGVVMAILLPLSALDAATFWMAGSATDRVRVETVSPDARVRVTAIRTHRLGASHYRFIAEKNVPRPWVSQSLRSASVPDAAWPAMSASQAAEEVARVEGYRLAWSADSQVVALWFKEVPLAAFDFSRQEGLAISDTAWIEEGQSGDEAYRQASIRFRDVLRRLIEEHGGPQ